MSADRLGITADELRYRERAKPKPATPREFRCDECGARCTRTLRGREAFEGRTARKLCESRPGQCSEKGSETRRYGIGFLLIICDCAPFEDVHTISSVSPSAPVCEQ